ncbi:MAG: NfeD family protein [Caldilineaceae bacterium]|nr:NfeD family protein [Caldilineaceae bacterium]
MNLPYSLDGHWVWASVGVVFLIAEIFTGFNVVVEVLVFCGVTVIAYFAMRPFAARVTNAPDVSFGVDRLIGMSGTVTQAIDGVNTSGMVKIRGEEWRARSTDGTAIPEGSEVVVQSVDGAHLQVSWPPA